MIKSKNDALLTTESKNLCPRLCPKWDSCNAPVCPLDANWQLQIHLQGEPVCRWLREAVKSGSEPILKRALSDESIARVVVVAEILISRKGPLKTRLERAASQKSKSRTIAPWQRVIYV